MRTFNFGDPEPAGVRVVRDRHGDVWVLNETGKYWESYETAPFRWVDMKRSWFPMKDVTP